MTSSTHTVIIGAGPYGLSLAAHLRENGVPFRIFGRPMETWSTQMPEGMKLKSDGFASSLFAGSKTSWTLQDFCSETGRLYHPTLHPVALEDFVAYGEEFARRFVPNLETHKVTMVEPWSPERATAPVQGRFRITLETGEYLEACEVVLAVGLAPFPFLPEHLRELPPERVSHTADHRTFEEFRSREVTVLGRGASALNAAALLHEAGARVTLVSRSRKLHIHLPARRRDRSFHQKLLHPSSPLGPSLRSWLATHLPLAFHAMPDFLRRGLLYKHLGPAGGSSLRGRVEGRVPMLLGWSIQRAELLQEATGQQIKLTLVNEQGETRQHLTSYVIAGTGFRVNTERLRFLAPSLRRSLRVGRRGAPELDRYFGSSVPGLYFVGPVAASSFGPLLRFAAGAGFAAARLAGHLARSFARTGTREAPGLTGPQISELAN